MHECVDQLTMIAVVFGVGVRSEPNSISGRELGGLKTLALHDVSPRQSMP